MSSEEKVECVEKSDCLGDPIIIADGQRRTGTCKWYNVTKGWGFISPDDGGTEVFVHQSVIKMDNGFRSLAKGEPLAFEAVASEKGLEATLVTAISEDSPLQGSSFRPHRRVKPGNRQRGRCYNCGEFSHVASNCTLGPQPKRCYICKSEDHLAGQCPSSPQRGEKSPQKKPNAPKGVTLGASNTESEC